MPVPVDSAVISSETPVLSLPIPIETVVKVLEDATWNEDNRVPSNEEPGLQLFARLDRITASEHSETQSSLIGARLSRICSGTAAIVKRHRLMHKTIHLKQRDGDNNWSRVDFLHDGDSEATLWDQISFIKVSCQELNRERFSQLNRIISHCRNLEALEICNFCLHDQPSEPIQDVTIELLSLFTGCPSSLKYVGLALNVSPAVFPHILDGVLWISSLQTLGLKLQYTGPKLAGVFVGLSARPPLPHFRQLAVDASLYTAYPILAEIGEVCALSALDDLAFKGCSSALPRLHPDEPYMFERLYASIWPSSEEEKYDILHSIPYENSRAITTEARNIQALLFYPYQHLISLRLTGGLDTFKRSLFTPPPHIDNYILILKEIKDRVAPNALLDELDIMHIFGWIFEDGVVFDELGDDDGDGDVVIANPVQGVEMFAGDDNEDDNPDFEPIALGEFSDYRSWSVYFALFLVGYTQRHRDCHLVIHFPDLSLRDLQTHARYTIQPPNTIEDEDATWTAIRYICNTPEYCNGNSFKMVFGED